MVGYVWFKFCYSDRCCRDLESGPGLASKIHGQQVRIREIPKIYVCFHFKFSSRRMAHVLTYKKTLAFAHRFKITLQHNKMTL